MSGVTARAVVPTLPNPSEAQQLIDDHIRSDVGGCCAACGQVEPCHWRELGHAALFAAGRLLPRRRKGIDRTPVKSKFLAFADS